MKELNAKTTIQLLNVYFTEGMKIKLGELEVYEAGSIISKNETSIDFTIENLTFTFQFENDITAEKNVAQAKVGDDPNRLTLVFINTVKGGGFSNTNPILMGWVKSRSLYLNYRIQSVNNTDKIIYYTWYFGEEMKDAK